MSESEELQKNKAEDLRLKEELQKAKLAAAQLKLDIKRKKEEDAIKRQQEKLKKQEEVRLAKEAREQQREALKAKKAEEHRLKEERRIARETARKLKAEEDQKKEEEKLRNQEEARLLAEQEGGIVGEDGLIIPDNEGIPQSNQQFEIIHPEDYHKLEKIDAQGARLKAVEYAYNTPPNRMRELTRLSKYEQGNLALVEMFAAIPRSYQHGGTSEPILLEDEWLQATYAGRRSIGGVHLEKLRQLAEASLYVEEGEVEHKTDFRG